MIIKTCSLNQVEFSNFGPKNEAADSNAIAEPIRDGIDYAWTYLALRKRYGEYGEKADQLVPLLNFYTWCARHGTRNSSSIVPDFVGYRKRPNWPSDEEYSRTMLVLYKPFTGSEDGLKGDNTESFAEALLEFITNPVFPRSIEAKIWRKKQSYCYVPEVGEEYQGGGAKSTPNEAERVYTLNDEALATAAVHNAFDKFADDIQDAEFNEGDLSGFDRGLNLDWSDGYKASGCTYLNAYSKQYYSKQGSTGHSEVFSLFDPKIYIPENCQGFAQTFLVCTTQYIVKQYTENPLLLQDPNHPCYNFFTQGNPGTGKSFVIMMILNCIRVLRRCVMKSAASVAPTGCATSLSKGRTSHRFFKFPGGNKINAPPYDSKISRIADAQAFLNQMEALFALVLDKVSMKGCKHFAWEDHRCREGGRHIASNADRTWGGIPVRHAFGDVQ
jgi:hypothetical protein